MADFSLPDVSAEHVLATARLAVTRNHSALGNTLDRQVVEKALSVSPEVARRAIAAAQQLGFIRADGPGRFSFCADDAIQYAKKSDLPLFYKKQLLTYPPFLIFVTQLSQEFEPFDAAAFTVAVLDMDTAPTTALKVLRNWGTLSGLLESRSGVLIPTFHPATLLDFGFIRRLNEAMESDARVRTFVIQELGADLVADMSKRGLGDFPVALADALLRHESEPRRVGDPVGSKVESYLATLFATPVQGNSLSDLATKLEQQGIILTSHRNLLLGLAGFRNPASHGPDKRTQKPWNVTPRGSLVGQVLAIVALRSIYLWIHAKKQEV